jgi:2'-5' RNA ligase
MIVCPLQTTQINEFAVVVYVPPPLGPALDEMRRELAPWMPPGRSHVTVLHPRPITSAPLAVWEDLKRVVKSAEPFEITAGEIDVFENTGVVYASLESGRRRLRSLHDAMNRNGASFEEPYPFHPHITIAKGLERSRLDDAASRAKELWRGYRGPRTFEVRECHFVQNTALDLWIDLGNLTLEPSAHVE